MSYSPTVIAASLSDAELKDSINKLVQHVEEGTKKMSQSFTDAVAKMKEQLQSLGSASFGTGGGSDSSSLRMTKRQHELTTAVDGTTTSVEKLASAMQKAAESSDKQIFSTIDTQIAIFKEELKQAEKQVLSFTEMARGAAVSGDKGLFVFATKNLHEQEDSVARLKRQIEELTEKRAQLQQVTAPQGDAIRNFVQDLQRANPELQRLNEQYKNGTSLLQQQSKEQQTTTKDLGTFVDLSGKANAERLKAIDIENENRRAIEMQKAAKSSDKQIFSTIDTQIAIFKEELKQAEKQVLSFTEMARGAAVSGDKGLFVFATKNLHEQEDSVARLKRQIEELTEKRAQLQQVTAPQGDAIRNFVQDLQRANPELQRLNEQYKNGTSLLQQQSKEQQTTTKDLGTFVDLSGKANAERLKAIDIENENRRAIEMQNAATAENLAFQQRINAVRAQSQNEKYAKMAQETNELRGAIAGLLNVEEKEIKNLDIEKASYNQLSSYLKQLQGAYNRLSGEMARGGYGKMFAEEIQKVQLAMSKIQKVQGTPISKDAVFGIKVQTLDDINYKIQQLTRYQTSLNITNPNDVKEIQNVTKAIEDLKKKKNELLNQNKTLLESNNALARSWNYMKNRLVFYFTVGASTQFVKNLIEIRSQYEMNEKALGILINSAERGTEIFKELSQMALVSPYTLIELSSAAKQLTAYDIAAKDVVDTTRRLADMTAAVGIPIERLTYALGQIKSYGYLNSRDNRMFANAGIPLVRNLAEYYSQLEGKLVSTADVYDRIKKKAVDYNDVMKVITKMTDEGGKFFDYQAKMAETLKVQLANLNLAWNNMLNDIGANSQGVISTALGWLRKLFLHWKDIEQIINRSILALGIFKASQIAIVAFTQKVGLATAAVSVLPTRIYKAALSIKGAFTTILGSWQLLLAAFAAYAVVDVFATMYKNAENIRKLNTAIAENSEEAAKSIDKLLKSQSMLNIRLNANAKTLSQSEAEKAWTVIKEEIEKSSIAASQLIPQLLLTEDITERLGKAFEMAEAIRDVEYRLSNLTNELKIDQDTPIFGAFGEGLAEDLQDYQEFVDFIDEITAFESKRQRDFWESVGIMARSITTMISEGFGNSFEEAEKEAKEFATNAANTIEDLLGKDLLGKTDVKSVTQLAEAVARVKKEVFAANPQIRGRAKSLLESQIDTVFGERFKAYDTAAAATNKFLDQLQRDYGSAFSSITTDILDKNKKWNSEQRNAFKETYEKLKTEIPESWAKILDTMLKDMNSRDWTVRVMAKFDVTTLSDVQKAFNDTFIEPQKGLKYTDEEYEKQKIENERKYGSLRRKDGEDNVAYEKRISEEKQKQQNIEKANLEIYNKQANKQSAVAKDAKKSAEEAKEWLNAANAVEKWGGYNFSIKNDTKARKQAESELQKALKSELQLIEKVSSTYNELTKSGTTHFNAIKKSTEGFDESVANINKVLNKYGLNFDLSKFAGTQNPREIVNMLQQQINTLLTKAKPAEIQDLQVEVQKLNLKVETFDQKTLADSLNNQLSKLKDEYELAVELDANPELGDLFTNMFGIDTSSFPHTISEYMQRVQDEFNTEIDKRGWGLSVNVFKANAEAWKQWGDAIGLSKEALDQFKAKFVEAQGVAEKWAKDVITQTKQLEYELGDVNKKIEIEQKKLSKLYADWFTATLNGDVQSARLLELQIEKQEKVIENLKQESIKLLPFYKELFGDIYNASTKTLKGIVSRTKEILATRNGDNGVGSVQRKNEKGKVVYDIFAKDENGEIKKTTVSLEEYIKMNKQVDSIQQKVAQSSPWEQIKDSFKKNEEGKIKNLGAGLQAIGGEVIKIGNIAKELGGFAEALGFDENTVEIINDVSTSITGMGTAVQGIGQIASGDYLGGIATTLSGVFSAISTWFDNSDKKILSMIKDSELAVKRLEVSYKNLQNAEEDAFGTAVMGAQQAMKANRELQLVELKRQLALEQRRDGKHRDEERIASLRSEIIDLEHEIDKATSNTLNALLGISSHGDFFEDMISSMIEAFKNGEDAMKVFEEKWASMIDNMVTKMILEKVLSNWVKTLESGATSIMEKYTGEYARGISSTQNQIDFLRSMDAGDISEWLYANDNAWFNQILKNLGLSKSFNAAQNKRLWFDEAWNRGWLQQIADAYLSMLEGNMGALNTQMEQATLDATGDLIDYYGDAGKEFMENQVPKILDAIKEQYTFGQSNEAQLSALQQGIQGITENTAGVLESYMNGVSQQVYLHSDLLTQIRDAVIGFDMDASLGVQSQMLFELQQSYAVQMAIQNILAGWSSANGLAVKVEMV